MRVTLAVALRQTDHMPKVLVADLVAGTHLLIIFSLVVGGLLTWRWPRTLWAHVPCVAAVLVVNLLGADCPLTTLELRLRQAAGEQPYGGGFVSHYLIEPWHPEGITPIVRAAIYGAVIAPNVMAYSVLLTRQLRRPDADRDFGCVGRAGRMQP